MKILNVIQGSEEWENSRKGRITGTKLADLVVKRGFGRKLGFYSLLADKLAVDDSGASDDPMERGHDLEQTAIDLFSEKTGKKVERVGLCLSDKNENIALSPDGLIKVKGKYKEAVEVKALSASRHLQAMFENKIPSEYEFQVLQYFIVCEDLQTLYFVFYDPRITAKPIFWLEARREDLLEDIEAYTEYQEKVLKELDECLQTLF